MLYIAENAEVELSGFTSIVDLDESIGQDEFFDMLADAIGPDIELIAELVYTNNVISREDYEKAIIDLREYIDSSDILMYSLTFNEYVEKLKEELEFCR